MPVAKVEIEQNENLIEGNHRVQHSNTILSDTRLGTVGSTSTFRRSGDLQSFLMKSSVFRKQPIKNKLSVNKRKNTYYP